MSRQCFLRGQFPGFITRSRADSVSSDGGPAIDKTILVNVKPKLISGHETHMGLESRTY
jgi:hypothetical protein